MVAIEKEKRKRSVQYKVTFNALKTTYVPKLWTLVSSLTPVLRDLKNYPYAGR